MTKNRVYLGKIVKIRSKEDWRYAFVQPLMQSSEDTSFWEGEIENLQEEFPSRGQIYWYKVPPALREDTYLQLEVEEHPRFLSHPDGEAYQVKTWKEPIEIIDLRSSGSEFSIRESLTSEGVNLDYPPIVNRCLLWVEDNRWIGPLNIERMTTTQSWKLCEGQNLSLVSCWTISKAAYTRVELQGTHWLLGPRQELGKTITYTNWEPDEVLAGRVLKHLRKMDPSTLKALEVTKKLFDAYLEAVKHAGLVGPDKEKEWAFAERIHGIREVIARNHRLTEEAAGVCFEVKQVKDELAKKAEDAYDRLLSEQDQQLENDLADQRKQLAEVNRELSKKFFELERLEGDMQAKRKELSELVKSFETALVERLTEIAGRPNRFFAEAAILRAILRATDTGFRKTETSNPQASRGQILSDTSPILEGRQSVFAEIGRRSMAANLSPFLVRDLHTTFVSGAIPVLMGSDPYDILETYGFSVAGGRLHWVPVGGTTYEPQDLLGKFDPRTGTFIPHPCGLIDVLFMGRESGEVHLVVLDGFNRAPVEAYLLPFLQSLRDSFRRSTPRSIPILHPSQAGGRTGPFETERVTWPSNVLLALVPVFGTAVHPVPAMLWEHAALLNCDLEAPFEMLAPVDPSGSDIAADSQPPQISSDCWREWVRDVRLASFGEDTKSLLQALSELGINRSGKDKTLRLYGAARVDGSDHKSAISFTLRTCVVPLAVVAGHDIEAVSRKLGVQYDDETKKAEEDVRLLGE